VFSSILVKVSYRASDTKAAREKHDRPAGTTAVLFHKKTRELSRQLAELREAIPPETPDAEIALADARDARPTTDVALVLTSPPYPSTYDYLPMQHLRHVWLGSARTRHSRLARAGCGGACAARARSGAATPIGGRRTSPTRWSPAATWSSIGDGLLPSGIVDAAQPTLDSARRAGLESSSARRSSGPSTRAYEPARARVRVPEAWHSGAQSSSVYFRAEPPPSRLGTSLAFARASSERVGQIEPDRVHEQEQQVLHVGDLPAKRLRGLLAQLRLELRRILPQHQLAQLAGLAASASTRSFGL
jgi:hypothetical protein